MYVFWKVRKSWRIYLQDLLHAMRAALDFIRKAKWHTYANLVKSSSEFLSNGNYENLTISKQNCLGTPTVLP